MSYKQQIADLAEKLGVDASVVGEISTIVEAAIAKGVEDREGELKQQVEEAAKQAAEQLVEARQAMEAEVKAQAEAVAKQFVQENKERFVQTEHYDRMVQFVDQITESFATVGIEADGRKQIDEQAKTIAELEAKVAELTEQAETAQAASLLQKMLSESSLSQVGRDRVVSLLKHTKPENIVEFEAIVKHLIEDCEEDDKEIDEDEDEDKEGKEPEKKSEDNVDESMKSYLDALRVK
jgi:hypothetical protein|nr:MAG TPA: hypothetical protein [Caudoviricetes sp.]